MFYVCQVSNCKPFGQLSSQLQFTEALSTNLRYFFPFLVTLCIYFTTVQMVVLYFLLLYICFNYLSYLSAL